MRALPKVPGYELLRCLGGGALTRVYAARDCTSDEICAVKLIREDWRDPVTAVKLLQREARAGLAVQHPHLVKTQYVHVTRPPYFLVMEMLPGESLRCRLRRDYRLDVPTALWIIRQTAEALAALHRAGFLHGDVKPENIRLVDDGTAKLIDLGFAHRPGENAAFYRHGYVLGTANYMAPEVVRRRQTSQALDIFSFGVTAYELCAFELPWARGTGVAAMTHGTHEPADIRKYCPAIDPRLERAIFACLEAEPENRPATMEDFLRMIKDVSHEFVKER